MAKLAADDREIAKRVSGLLCEALFNIVTMLQDSFRDSPLGPDDGSPYVSFELLGDGDEEREQNEPEKLAQSGPGKGNRSNRGDI